MFLEWCQVYMLASRALEYFRLYMPIGLERYGCQVLRFVLMSCATFTATMAAHSQLIGDLQDFVVSHSTQVDFYDLYAGGYFSYDLTLMAWMALTTTHPGFRDPYFWVHHFFGIGVFPFLAVRCIGFHIGHFLI